MRSKQANYQLSFFCLVHADNQGQNMRNVIWATPLYKFLRYCSSSSLEKTVLDCGAGGDRPPLRLFYEYGYRTYGVEVDERAIEEVKNFCRKNNMDLNMLKGDMRRIPFRDESFGFAYSFNAIIFMTKKDIAVAMKEIERVLKPSGLCFVNFLSVDEPQRDTFCKPFLGSKGFSYYEDDEPDSYFRNFEVIHKEKRILERKTDGKKTKQAYIDYITKKVSTTPQKK